MAIYKIARPHEWSEMEETGSFKGAPVDLADGYIHFSTATQAEETAAKHFAGEEGLLLVMVDDAALGEALRWEESRGGQLFPHLYRPLKATDVVWVRPLPLDHDGTHRFPEDIA